MRLAESETRAHEAEPQKTRTQATCCNKSDRDHFRTYGITLNGALLFRVLFGVVTVMYPEVAPRGTSAEIREGWRMLNSAGVPLNVTAVTATGGADNACTLGCGTVFVITSGGTLTTLHHFAQSATDGAGPNAGLVLGEDGELYGTTASAGADDYGTIFKITPTGSLTTIYSFCPHLNCAEGGQPEAGLSLGTDGNFYTRLEHKSCTA